MGGFLLTWQLKCMKVTPFLFPTSHVQDKANAAFMTDLPLIRA